VAKRIEPAANRSVLHVLAFKRLTEAAGALGWNHLSFRGESDDPGSMVRGIIIGTPEYVLKLEAALVAVGTKNRRRRVARK
jgi:hypothetical protein